ncbi:MAG: hypothetical protein HOK89_01360, partial [Rhodospirillaceae bacterium]|nr:hypothetical protein [Rhodospirillaceae bacterium]
MSDESQKDPATKGGDDNNLNITSQESIAKTVDENPTETNLNQESNEEPAPIDDMGLDKEDEQNLSPKNLDLENIDPPLPIDLETQTEEYSNSNNSVITDEQNQDVPPENEDSQIDFDEDFDKLNLQDIDFPDDNFQVDDEGQSKSKKKWWILTICSIAVIFVASAAFFIFKPKSSNDKTEQIGSNAILSFEIPNSKIKSNTKISKLSVGKSKKVNNKDVKTTKTLSGGKSRKSKLSKKIRNAPLRTQKGDLIVPSVTTAAFKGIPMMKNPKPLAGPDKKLSETVGGGVIPKISDDGTQPWKFYAKPFNGEVTLPRIAIIIKGLGFSKAATIAAINHTPSSVTLAFDPYAKGVGNWVGLARSAGHETLISLPMEPLDFPASDPGPFALQTNLSSSENINRLHFLLSVSMGNVGLLKMMGSNFVASEQALMPILKEIKNRGLIMIDDGSTKNSQIIRIGSNIELPQARGDIFIDADPSRGGVANGLAELEKIAKRNKRAVGIARSLPNTISLI